MSSLKRYILITSLFLSGCTITNTQKEEGLGASIDKSGAQGRNNYEPNKFSFGDLLLVLPDDRNTEITTCGDIITEFVEKEYRCQEFKVDGKTFFEGVYRKVKGEVAEGGIFEDASEPKLILDTLYFKRIILNDKTYILAIEYDYHDTLSVLYQLSIVDNKVNFDKIHSINASFDTVHQVPGGVIFSGYNYQKWIPWAAYFDGETVQDLEFLGEPDELIPWNPDDDEKEKIEEKIRY